MASNLRQVYQPSFEDTQYSYEVQEDDIEDARARLPLLIVIALLVLAAFAGVVWLAYNQGVKHGQVGLPTVITAPDGPVRTPPDTQTAEVPYTGLKVYGEPVAPEQEAAASSLAPAAPEAIVPAAEPAPVVAAASPAATPPPAARIVTPPPAPVVAAAPPPRQAPAAPRAPVTPPPAIAVSLPAAAAPRPAPAPQAAAAPASAATRATGPMLQIGAYPSEELALSAWNNFRARYATAIGGLTQNVQVADLGERGTWYRLRVGPFNSKDAAVEKCEQLREAGGTCFVAAP